MTSATQPPTHAEDLEALFNSFFGFANFASRQSDEAVSDLVSLIKEKSYKFMTTADEDEDPLVTELQLVLRNIKQGDEVERDLHRFKHPAANADGKRFNALLQVMLSGLGEFDNDYPAVRKAIEQRLGDSNVDQVVGRCGAARINAGRAVFTLNEICVNIFGLKDRESDIPVLTQAAESIGLPEREVSGVDANLPDSNSAVGGYDDLDLAVSDNELLQHPEVRQVRILEEIAKATVALASIEKRRSDLVSEARSLSISWARIGSAAQITSQGALRKWDSNAREKHRGYADKAEDGPTS